MLCHHHAAWALTDRPGQKFIRSKLIIIIIVITALQTATKGGGGLPSNQTFVKQVIFFLIPIILTTADTCVDLDKWP